VGNGARGGRFGSKKLKGMRHWGGKDEKFELRWPEPELSLKPKAGQEGGGETGRRGEQLCLRSGQWAVEKVIGA